MSEEDYGRTMQLFSDIFGVSYLESEEFKRLNRDLEVLQQTVVPTLYKAFKKTTATYAELTELCMSSERGRKISQKREEMGVAYRQSFRFLVLATRLFLLMVGEVSDGQFSAASFPVKVIHELLGSPGTKECIVFLTDLALLQSNRLLADQLFDYLLGFPGSVQNECYLVRRRLSEFRDRSFDHQLLSITSNFDSSQYFPGLSERQGSIAVVLFKIKNLMRNLWMVGKSYTDLMAWWRTNYVGFLDSLCRLGVSELYGRLEDGQLGDLPVSAFFEPDEHWELSALCGMTGYVLYMAHLSIMDGDEQVEEAVASFHFESQGYPVSALIEEAIKFSILSILLDPTDYRAAWLLSLLHLADSEQFSLTHSLRFVRLTISLNPSFGDPWVLYCLLWTGNVNHDQDYFAGLSNGLDEDEAATEVRDRLKRMSPALITSKMISLLASGDDSLRIPLRFVHLGHSIFQIVRNREGNDDLCYVVISDILELNQWLAEQKARRERETEMERTPTMSSVSASPSSKSRRGCKEARTVPCPDHAGKSAPELDSDSSPLIAHPLLFRLQLLIWSFKLKQFLRSDGVHICSEFIVSQLDDFLQLHRTTLERDLDLLDELHIHSHIGSYLRTLSDKFSAALRDDGLWRESVSCESRYIGSGSTPLESLLFPRLRSKSPFEVDLIDWRVVLSPIHCLY